MAQLSDEDACKIALAMEQLMCKKCAQYKNGCTPFEVIQCTEYFMDQIEKAGGIFNHAPSNI